MAIVRLIYTSKYRISAATAPMVDQLNDILSTANRHNKRNGITGALMFDSRWFVQILEGEREQVWSTFRRLEHDPRHSGVKFIEMAAIEERAFGAWCMGCAERSTGNAAIFAPYLRDGRFEPNAMTGHELLSLLTDLAAAGLTASMASVEAK